MLNSIKNKDKVTRLEILVYDNTALLFQGYLSGEYLEDTKAMEYEVDADTPDIKIPAFYYRDIIRYDFE